MTARCLALLVLALGLVLMHHTVIAGPTVTTASGVEHTTGQSTAHSTAHSPEHAAPTPTPPGHGHEGEHGGMLLHLCLAVLAALGVVLLMAGHAGRRPSPDDDRDDAPVRAVAVPARPPPVPVRLARLQVLRL